MKRAHLTNLAVPWLVVAALLGLPGCKRASSPAASASAPHQHTKPAHAASSGEPKIPAALAEIPGLSCERPINGVFNCRAAGYDISGSDDSCDPQSASFGRVVAERVVLLSRPSRDARHRSGQLARGQWVCVQYWADSTTGRDSWEYVTAIPPTMVPGCDDHGDCTADTNTGAVAQPSSETCRTDGSGRYATTCLAGWVPHDAITVHSMGLEGQFAEGATADSASRETPDAVGLPADFKRYASTPTPSGQCLAGALIDDLGLQKAVVMAIDASGRRRWMTQLPTTAGFYQSRATHCTCSKAACYAAIAIDTHPSPSVSQTLLSIAKLDPASGKHIADRPIEPTGAEHARSTWMGADDSLVIRGHALSLSGRWRSNAEDDPHRFDKTIQLF